MFSRMDARNMITKTPAKFSENLSMTALRMNTISNVTKNIFVTDEIEYHACAYHHHTYHHLHRHKYQRPSLN